MLHIHLGAFHRVDHHIRGVFGAMAAPCRSPKPFILLRRHEHERSAPMPGYLHWLALRFVLKSAELAVELKGAHGWQGSLPK